MKILLTIITVFTISNLYAKDDLKSVSNHIINNLGTKRLNDLGIQKDTILDLDNDGKNEK